MAQSIPRAAVDILSEKCPQHRWYRVEPGIVTFEVEIVQPSLIRFA